MLRILTALAMLPALAYLATFSVARGGETVITTRGSTFSPRTGTVRRNSTTIIRTPNRKPAPPKPARGDGINWVDGMEKYSFAAPYLETPAPPVATVTTFADGTTVTIRPRGAK
jgi:hypothetical protein